MRTRTARLSEASGVKRMGDESRREWPLQPWRFFRLVWLPFKWLVGKEGVCACMCKRVKVPRQDLLSEDLAQSPLAPGEPINASESPRATVDIRPMSRKKGESDWEAERGWF